MFSGVSVLRKDFVVPEKISRGGTSTIMYVVVNSQIMYVT